jgi:hypothetical protein
VRRHPVPSGGAARSGERLLLPHVPEGVERGFCPDCGTPLTYRKIDSGNVSLTLHSLDDPGAVVPDRCFSPEMRASWCLALEALPVEPTPEAAEPGFVGHQYPDG